MQDVVMVTCRTAQLMRCVNPGKGMARSGHTYFRGKLWEVGLTWMTSALALATPDATVPIPAWATSFTLTWLCGATCRRTTQG